MTDERTVVQAQAGDSGALESLMRRYDQPMLRYFFRLSRDPELARDLRQELFCKLLSVLPRYDARKSAFKTWFYRLARNLAIDRIHRRRGREVQPFDEGTFVELVSGDAPRAAASAGELKDALSQAVSRLPEIDRSIIALKHEAELTFAEIGRTLGMPESTVKSRLYRAFELIREELVARGHGPEQCS